MDTFFQDNWRMRPNLSVNLGIRYAVQPPFVAMNASYSTATLDSLWGEVRQRARLRAEHRRSGPATSSSPAMPITCRTTSTSARA